MPGIREKPKMYKPKERDRKTVMPKERDPIKRKPHEEQNVEARDGSVREATDTVEGKGEDAVYNVANSARQGVRKIARAAKKPKPWRDIPAPPPVREAPSLQLPGARPIRELPPAQLPEPTRPKIDLPQAGGGRAEPPSRTAAVGPTVRRGGAGKVTERTVQGQRQGGIVRPRATLSGGGKPAKGTAAPKQARVFPRTKAAHISRKAAKPVKGQVKNQAIHRLKEAAKAAAQTIAKATAAIVRAVTATINLIAGIVGGGVLLVSIVVIIVIAAIASSPFGIFFASEPARDSIPLAAAVTQITAELTAEMEARQTVRVYDGIVVEGAMADWVEVVAVFACKSVMGDAVDVATLDADRVARLAAVMRDMTVITYGVEEIAYPEVATEYILHIRIEAKSADSMATRYGFSDQQKEALAELLASRVELAGLIHSLAVTSETAQEVLQTLPPDLAPERHATVQAALSLVGKVNYFWGGKSYVQGWDNAWGTLRRVTADGSSTTGTYRPYGLDCTGYLGWAFQNAGLTSAGTWHIGGNTTAVTWEAAQPGDLAFNADESHVGLVVGRDTDGYVLVAHCSYAANCVVITKAIGQFVTVGTPEGYSAG